MTPLPANGSEPGASHSLTRRLLAALPCQLPRGRKGDGSIPGLERVVTVPGGSGGLLLSPCVKGEPVPRGVLHSQCPDVIEGQQSQCLVWHILQLMP